MRFRSNWAAHAAHAVALGAAGLGAALALIPDALQDVAGVQRSVLAAYLIANAAVLEIYVGMRRVLAVSTWHHILSYAVYVLIESLLRSVALLNIGVAAAGLYYVPDRLWLLPFAALGVFAFVVSIRFPVPEADWTERDVIRIYAQESPRYARWLLFAQVFYATANTASLAVGIGLAIAFLTAVAPVVLEAFTSQATVTVDGLAALFDEGVASALSFLTVRFAIIAVAIVVAIFVSNLVEALSALWRGEEQDDAPFL